MNTRSRKPKEEEDEKLSPQDQALKETILAKHRDETAARIVQANVTPPRTITQARLVAFLQLEAAHLNLKQRYEEEEQALLDAVELGAEVEAGTFGAFLKVRSLRRPSWKEHFIAVCGKAKADEIHNTCPPTFSISLVVKVKSVIKEAAEKLYQGFSGR